MSIIIIYCSCSLWTISHCVSANKWDEAVRLVQLKLIESKQGWKSSRLSSESRVSRLQLKIEDSVIFNFEDICCMRESPGPGFIIKNESSQSGSGKRGQLAASVMVDLTQPASFVVVFSREYWSDSRHWVPVNPLNPGAWPRILSRSVALVVWSLSEE